jgi:deazaflavin-dependent oxidoreductase (nitroreductase family)
MDLPNRNWWHELNQNAIEQFRASDGKPGGPWAEKLVLLLTYTGRKSGISRQIPLCYFLDGETILVMAAKGGYDQHPEWYLSIEANPNVQVTVGTETYVAIAESLSEPERTVMFERFAAIDKDVAATQAMTARRFPVIALRRTPGSK